MKYVDFKATMLWKRIDVDGFPKIGKYQCVDLFKFYCDKVYGIRLNKTWNANQIRKNTYRIFSPAWKRLSILVSLRQWDVILSIKWEFWHVAIFDHEENWLIYVLEQNWVWWGNWLGWNAIRLKGYPRRFFIWVWRYM